MRAGAIITETPLDPLVAFAELGRMKLGESDLQAVLSRATIVRGLADDSLRLVQRLRGDTGDVTLGSLAVGAEVDARVIA